MQAATAVVLGATGLIGQQLLQILLNDNTFTEIRALVRSKLPFSHDKLRAVVVDFNDQAAFRNAIGQGDCVFCCIGTTMKKVKGDKEAYRKVDYDIAVNAGQYAIAQGFSQYALVSAIGANAGSSNFYLRLKGEVENAIAAMPFRSTHIFRPSVLLGERKEQRTGESIAQSLMSALSFLLIGSAKKYKPIQGKEVAAAMVAAIKSENPGKHIYHYEEIRRLVAGNK
jgi:uncharacterized protein YbjT (DUF2867 family)